MTRVVGILRKRMMYNDSGICHINVTGGVQTDLGKSLDPGKRTAIRLSQLCDNTE